MNISRKTNTDQYEAVVIGVSAGGISALGKILPQLDKAFSLPVLIVQHIGQQADGYLIKHFASRCPLFVKEAEDKEKIISGHIYFAPPDYHLLIEPQQTLALSGEEKIHYCRPSIDVLFETAAEVYCERLIGIILTGANNDGANGLKKIKSYGGLTIVQSPETAEVDIMPKAAINAFEVDHVLPLADIAPLLVKLDRTGTE